MRHLRAVVRILSLALLTGSVYLSWLLTRLFSPLAPGLARRSRAILARTWAQGAAATLGLGLEVRGQPPTPPFLLVSNHLSYVDVLVLWSRLDCVFLAKADVAGWPVIGRLARSAGTLFVDRERGGDLPRVLDGAATLLAQGRGVAVFPEGTSSAGERVLSFKPSLFEVALRAGLPVSCAAITYRTPPGEPSARQAVCWWGDMSFLPHLYRLLGLASFRAVLTFAAEPVAGGDRKILAREAERAVGLLFTPVPG